MYFTLHFIRSSRLNEEAHLLGKVLLNKFSFDQFLQVDYSAFNALSLCGKDTNFNRKRDPDATPSTIFDFYSR